MKLRSPRKPEPSRLPEARERSLAMRPIRNPFVELEQPEESEAGEGEGAADADGGVLLIPVERTKRGRLITWLLRRLSRRPVPTVKRIELDEMGAFVWRLCDGTRSTRELIRELARKYHLNRRDAEASLVEFLRMLGRRNLVGFQVKAKREKKAAPEERG